MLKPTQANTQHNIDELFNKIKELTIKSKTVLEEENKELLKEIFTQQISTVLNSTYDALNHLDEKRLFNGHVIRFENNPDSIDNHIKHYQLLADKAKENEDDNRTWRHEFSIGIYQQLKKNHDNALQILRLMITSNLMLDDKEFYNIQMTFLKRKNQAEYKNVDKHYKNKDLFISLYGQLEGYKISHEQIIKSAGLKIFNFFNAITKVQKKSLADRIEHIFASLDEEISIDSKRASNIRIVGEFNGIALLDYGNNKKGILKDFGIHEIIETLLTKTIKDLKKSGNKAMIKRINKTKELLEVNFIQQLLS